MKVKLELFGASRDFSNKDYLEFNIKEKIEIKDLRREIIITWILILKVMKIL